MKCEEIRERMPDVAAGLGEFTSDENNHLASCTGCAEQLKAMRATMSLLDEWQVPEPSPYFDVRLQARLREEMAKPQAGWLHWFRRPVLAAALTVVMGIGIGVFFVTGGEKQSGKKEVPTASNITNSPSIAADPGSAVGDLQSLDKNDDMYANFELLDDLDLQQNVDETPQNADD
jgi:hypothetical protein